MKMKGKHFIALSLILITLFVFLPVKNFDFADRDDEINVHGDPFLNPPTLEKIAYFWKEPYEALYIPMTYTVWSAIAGISENFSEDGKGAKMNPAMFHIANLIVHLLNLLMVFAILNLLLSSYLSPVAKWLQQQQPQLTLTKQSPSFCA